MGSFDAEAVATAMLPPVETIPFLAPEQRGGGGIDPASDVFSLGVLGYYLLTEHYPFGEGTALLALEPDLGRVKPISTFLNSPPFWADELLMKCLNPRSELRYRSAGEVLKGLSDLRQGASEQDRMPVKLRNAAVPVLRRDRGVPGLRPGTGLTWADNNPRWRSGSGTCRRSRWKEGEEWRGR